MNRLPKVAALVVGIAALGFWIAWNARNRASAPASAASPPASTQPENPATSPDAMVYIYDAPESADDHRYDYEWQILRTSLERTRPKWGDYHMEPSVFMSEQRQAAELKNASGKLTVMYLGTTPDFEQSLYPVHIPVDRNLGGYMVMLIRKEDQPQFSAVKSLDDLKQFKIGLGQGWLDVDILRAAKFNVVTGSNYDGLFEMLVNSRFDAFSRAAVEVLGEYAARKGKIPDLHVEESFILYYPLPMYFWFPKTAQGLRLHDRAQEGMLAMYDDGTYLKLFAKYQQPKIDSLRLNLRDRKLFTIKNPNLDTISVPFDDPRLWFDIKTGR